MLTIVISNNRKNEDLINTLKSIATSCENPDFVEIKVLDFIKKTKPISDYCNGLKLTRTDFYKKKKSEAFSAVLETLTDDYVLFANSGDVFSRDFFTAAIKIFSSDSLSADIIQFNTLQIEYEEASCELKRVRKSTGPECINDIDLNEDPSSVPTDTIGVVFRTSSLKEVGIDTGLRLDYLKASMYAILNSANRFTRVDNITIKSAYPLISNSVNFLGMHDEKWYFHSLEKFLLPILEKYQENGKTKLFIQYAALNELRWRFVYNRNNDNKHVVDNKLERFESLCQQILSHIDNSVIFNLTNSSGYSMIRGLCYAMIYIKYNKSVNSSYIYDKKNILRCFEDIVMMRASLLRTIIELLEFENGFLTIEASVDDFMDMTKCKLLCTLDNTEIDIVQTYRFAHTKYFGVSTNKRYTFKVMLPESSIKENSVLKFYLDFEGFKVELPYTTRRYTSKISSNIKHSYWKFGENDMAVFLNNNNCDLVFSKIKGFRRFRRELALLFGMLGGTQRSYRMFLIRVFYWITRPYFRKKKIWITYDKLYKGGDCGEYFYKYMMKMNDGITPAYVINKDAEDTKRLHSEGFRPLYYGSLKNILYYLNADAVFATHGGVHTFNGISNSRIKYVSDLINADVTCIQHGLSVQQLAQELNRLYNNTKRYYCASKYEIQNLEHPIYGYEDKSILRLTGIPRYDGLISNDKKQILITPTWRAYISMPPVMGHSRPYYPEFKKTDYYKIYYNLLTDEKLIATARRTGYKLIYLLHPIISSQIIDYPDIDGVEIIPATSVNYEKILTESSLMLTDYSGVQFDFAYMRKPVVYYHPPKLPPHYKEGGFFYETMGFGEICTEHSQMVDCLCEYMDNDCEVKPMYKDRANDFFAYSDQDSCKRIYDDFIQYKKQKSEK